MQRIWQVRPKSQGKGNDVREAEGRSTAQLPAPPWAPHPPQTCSARLLSLGSASGERQGLMRLSPSVQQGS